MSELSCLSGVVHVLKTTSFFFFAVSGSCCDGLLHCWRSICASHGRWKHHCAEARNHFPWRTSTGLLSFPSEIQIPIRCHEKHSRNTLFVISVLLRISVRWFFDRSKLPLEKKFLQRTLVVLIFTASMKLTALYMTLGITSGFVFHLDLSYL